MTFIEAIEEIRNGPIANISEDFGEERCLQLLTSKSFADLMGHPVTSSELLAFYLGYKVAKLEAIKQEGKI